MKLAVITGSGEAASLCAALERQHDVTPFDGAALPERFGADAVIDASHPCEPATQSAVIALCAVSDLPCLRFRRPGWTRGRRDDWRGVADGDSARAALEPGWSRVFLCLGFRERAAFAGDPDRWYLLRARTEPAPEEGFLHAGYTPKSGPLTAEGEAALMRAHGIDVLVTRNAGGEGAFPKLAAARALGLPVVLIERPPVPGPEASSVAEVMAWLDGLPAR